MRNASRVRVYVVVGAVLAAAAVGLLVGVLFFGSDDDPADNANGVGDSTTSTTAAPGSSTTDGDGSTMPPPPTVPTAGLEGAALELAEAINQAATLTYHARYEGTAPPTQPGGPATELSIELWRQPPLARRDTTIVSGTESLRAQEFRLADRLVGCVVAQPGTELRCLPGTTGQVDPGHPVAGAVDPAAGPVTAEDAEVAGTAARCFTVTPTGAAPQVACFDTDGVPSAIDGGEGRLERVSVEPSFDDSVFTPPDS